MKRSIFIAICFLLSTLSFTAIAQNEAYLFCYFKGNGDGLHLAYSYDGYTWKPVLNDSILLRPTVSTDKLFRDPSIVRDKKGTYHMVWTVSWNDKGIGYASSKDLVHWSAQRFLPVMMHEPTAVNTWAPELTFDPKTKRYIIYWASTIPGRYPQKDTSAEGAKYNHRIYYVTTKNFKKYSKTKLLYDPAFSVIDAFIVPDNNRYVMFLKNETKAPAEKNIRVAYADKITGPYSQPTAPITGNYWAGGPAPLKIGDKWIVYFDKYRDHKYGAVESTDLTNWKDVSDKVKFPPGVRHGTAFKVTKDEMNKLLERSK